MDTGNITTVDDPMLVDPEYRDVPGLLMLIR